MPSVAEPPPLIGRAQELATLGAVTDQARAGHSGALVVTGAPGIGKTALLDATVARATAAGTRVERTVAAEAEIDLPYAGLHQLIARLHDGAALPAPQRAALDAAFGRSSASPPTPFLLGLALLGLLTETAADGPLVCVIDDAHWLDPPSSRALAFAARRLGEEGVVMLFGTRVVGDDLVGLPALTLAGLADDDARSLLSRALPQPIDQRVLNQLLAEADGNPLGLLELPRAIDPVALAGGFGMLTAQPLERRIEDSVLVGLEPVPEAGRALLLLAATDATGDPALLWAACERAGVDSAALSAVEATGALSIDLRVRFRHPLVRSAVYRAASPEQRRRAHALLADATDPATDPDRRAWHRAHAVHAPDEALAEELERSAARARARGGVAAAAAFLERAANLSVSRERQATRMLGAARAKLDAGAPEAARHLHGLVATARLTPLEVILAEALALDIDYALRRDTRSAQSLVELAQQVEPHDSELAFDLYQRALYRAIFSGGLTDLDDEQPGGTRRPPRFTAVAGTVLAATERGPRRPQDELLRGLALLKLGELARARPVVRGALARLLAPPSALGDLAWIPAACHAAIELWDHAMLRGLSARGVEIARAGGHLTALPLVLAFAGSAAFTYGDLDHAGAITSELQAVQDATGDRFPPYHEASAAAWRGDAERLSQVLGVLRRGAAERTEGSALSIANYAEAIHANGAGDFHRAVEVGREELPHIMDVGFSARILFELVEAATRTEQTALAREALGHLEAITLPAGGDWALGMLAAARAELGDDAAREEAVTRFDRGGLVLYAARARLAHGERLRRDGQRGKARDELRTAHATFVVRGAHGFAARAARELKAVGEAVGAGTASARGTLTAQEETVARLASDGLTNREIGGRLYLSDRTVEYHLRKVFQKLGIASRRELSRALEA
jgi:DNA-binding CsgD family transcriptional regulator